MNRAAREQVVTALLGARSALSGIEAGGGTPDEAEAAIRRASSRIAGALGDARENLLDSLRLNIAEAIAEVRSVGAPAPLPQMRELSTAAAQLVAAEQLLDTPELDR